MIKLSNFQIGIISIFLILASTSIVSAQSVDQLKQNIDSHSDKIKKLDAEIKVYEKQIEVVGTEAKSLQNAVKVLDINQKKIGVEIQKTGTNIQKTNLTIEKLGGEIGDIEAKILANNEAIAKILNDMRQSDDQSLIESFLNNKSLSDVFNEYESSSQFQQKVREKSKELEIYKDELSGKKVATETEKQKLVSLKTELGDQNQILAINKKEKTTLLTTTKNKEAEYKKMLADRQAEKDRFEKELFTFESQLKRAIDPKSFPSSGKGILSWPLDNVFITQYFGKTIDAKRLYTSGTHNGIDFRASRGTRVLAALNGTVEGTGNTDAQKGCYSYGKWVLIKHPNGLSTLYGHLDLISVTSGQTVETGEVIGYSGQTGYSTGPHLHLTLYASQGVEIQRYSSSINCKNVTIPVSGINAYLDPMLYF
ncbi:MAG: peptidoglycan DD-metalloendopeptidase family protein [Candidatus Paceibacterota bacterium]|jgi:murein DD-endopeptidase MepM/ murein hydrolase activator NlpD